MSLLVTSVTGVTKPKCKRQSEEDGGEGGEEEVAPTEEDNAREEAEERALPGLTFWICVRTHTCMVATFETQLLNMFHTCGFSLYQCAVSHT